MVYKELRRLAAARLRTERGDHTLSATALVNEAWLRFSPDVTEQDVENRRHFYGIALTAMRRILVEHARARNATKRGGANERVSLESIDAAASDDRQLMAVDEALTRLEAIQPRAARVVEMRFFGGYTHSEIAGILGIQRRTVDRDWAFARAWLFGHMGRPLPTYASQGPGL
jgi:RNA polymerase sigma factor (TIGR02999 family)